MEPVGECIQGLVLFGNQWLLFVELGGFVNNAVFLTSQSACLLAGVPLAIFICVFLFFFLFSLLMVCLWIGCNQAHYPVPASAWFYIRCTQAD